MMEEIEEFLFCAASRCCASSLKCAWILMSLNGDGIGLITAYEGKHSIFCPIYGAISNSSLGNFRQEIPATILQEINDMGKSGIAAIVGIGNVVSLMLSEIIYKRPDTTAEIPVSI